MFIGDQASLLRAVTEASDDALIATDLDGIVTYWSDQAERLYGYSSAEMLGQTFFKVIPPDNVNQEHPAADPLRTRDPVADRDVIRIGRDGRRFVVSETITAIRTPDGTVTGMVRLARVQSGLASDERAARRLAAVVESSDDAIVSKDLNGTVMSWNSAAARVFGYTAEEMVGESIRKIIPEERLSEEDDVLARIRRGERVDHFETLRRRKDGRLIPISLTVSPVRNRAGDVIGASKIARDISEAVRLKAVAEEQASIATRLGQVGAEVASTLDRDAIAQKVTDAATDLTHAELGAFFYNVSDSESGQAFVLHALSGGSKETFANVPRLRSTTIFGPTFRGEGALRLDDVTRDPRFAESSPYYGYPPGRAPVRSYLAVPVKSASGTVLGGLVFGHSDAGVFTLQHEQLATGIAAWASVALENAHLYVEAREANRVKDEFLAVLSHELRTPLNSVLGYARLLNGGILTGEKATRGLDALERNATLLTQIVEDVLDVSRIVSGKFRLDVQPVDLAMVVHNAIGTVSPAADAKGLRIQTAIDSRVGPVSGDPQRLQQVVWNLLTNAVKFTPKDGRVQVRVAAVNSHVEIVVSDTGSGIRPDFLPYVFERFRQADYGTTRKTGGLGLGLAIVRHIVEMHGGTVEASSGGDGQGATFRVSLPLMIVHADPAAGPREHPRRESETRLTELGNLTGVRVLAIDDEPDALALLRVVLEAAGAEVKILGSGVGALEHIESFGPHALVVDLGMPEMDGYAFITSVRASLLPAVRDVPAAALTAFARSEDRTKALRSGFEMHLAKPVNPSELVASVATLVRRGRPVPSAN